MAHRPDGSSPGGSSTDRLVLVVTSPRVAPGCLTWDAWQACRSGAVCTADPQHPQLSALEAAGVEVEVLRSASPDQLAAVFRGRATGTTAVWLAAPDGDQEFARALGQLVAREAAAGVPPELEVVHGSYDLPGARLLDAVAVMDRLRSPGGCPWDAEQTHGSLATYLLEEAYEAYEAIEEADDAGLREEMGDVLLQVLFHARVASERAADDPAGAGWTIDDVAGDLVEKLVRRHPHVFDDGAASRDGVVSDTADVERSWERLKAAEKGRTSVTDGVPMGQPALALAAKLQRRAVRSGLPTDLVSPLVTAAPSSAAAVAAGLALVEEQSGEVVAAVGQLLFAVVALAREHHVDAEAALRGESRRFRERLVAVERAARADGVDPLRHPLRR